MTNFERIRSMTAEELTDVLCCPNTVCCCDDFYWNCKTCLLKWLKEEVEEGVPGEVAELEYPCGNCVYNPPSSGDGKPCSNCWEGNCKREVSE